MAKFSMHRIAKYSVCPIPYVLSTSMVTVSSPVLLEAGVTPADRSASSLVSRAVKERERLVADDIPLCSHDSMLS